MNACPHKRLHKSLRELLINVVTILLLHTMAFLNVVIFVSVQSWKCVQLGENKSFRGAWTLFCAVIPCIVFVCVFYELLVYTSLRLWRSLSGMRATHLSLRSFHPEPSWARQGVSWLRHWWVTLLVCTAWPPHETARTLWQVRKHALLSPLGELCAYSVYAKLTKLQTF